MSKIDVYASGEEDGDRYINPYSYGTAEEFVADYSDEDYFYLGKEPKGVEVSEKLPVVVWYFAKYAETYGFDIVAAAFNEYGFLRGQHLVDLPGFESTLALYRQYDDVDALVDAYAAKHNIPDVFRDCVDGNKLVQKLAGHKVISTKPLIVEWSATDPAITEGWG